MTREQARKVKLSGNFLHSYIGGTGAGCRPPIRSFLLANAVIRMLAPLRRKSFDETLDELPPRDEGIPDNPSATPLWATTIDLVRYARGSGWKQVPQLSRVYDMPTALRNSFNLVVAVTFEFADQIGCPPADVAKTFADAAAVGDRAPAETVRVHRVPGPSPQPVVWFG